MAKRLKVNLAGGLGNQLNCYFAALYFAQKFGYELLTINYGTVNKIHIHPNSLINILPKSVLLKESKQIFIEFENIPTNLRLHGAFRSKGRHIYTLFKTLNGILDDSNYLSLPEHQYHEICESKFKIVSVNASRDVRLNGFFPSQWFFQELESKFYSSNSMINFSKIVSSRDVRSKNTVSEPYCALHLRVGDYYLPGKNTFGVVDESYYLNAVLHLQKEFPGIKIWAVSDQEILASKLYQRLLTKQVKLIRNLDKKSPLETFEFIRNANFVICANSSFSYWAARLNPNIEKVVIPATPHLSIAGVKSLPNNWIRIENGFLK